MSDSLDWAGLSAAIAAWVKLAGGLDSAHVWWAYEKRPRPTVPYVAISVQAIHKIGFDWSTYDDNPLVFTGTVTAVDTTANTLTVPSHGLGNGDGPFHFTSTLTLPAPLQVATDYWVIVVDANTLKLAASFVDTGGQMPLGTGNPQIPIDLTSSGSGTITFDSTDETLTAGEELIRTAQGHRVMTLRMEYIVADGAGYAALVGLENIRSGLEFSVDDLDAAGAGLADVDRQVQLLEGRRGGILEPRAVWELDLHLASNLTGFETIVAEIDATLNLTREDGQTPLPAISVLISDT